MATVRAAVEIPVAPDVAEAAWYDTSRWPEWVDGLEEVIAVRAPWPAVGGTVSWRSGPAGRGAVEEHVLEHHPQAGQSIEVRDGQISGRQTVGFRARGEDTRVELTLSYVLRRRNPLTAVVDRLFIRRAMTDALAHTLERFAVRAQDRT